MNFTKIVKVVSLFLILGFGLTACQSDRDDDGGGSSSDPFIGNWKLRVLTYQGQSQDVTNTACWKETTLVADKTNAKFTLVVPTDAGGCQNSSDSYEWTKKDGIYYYTENGQQQQLPIKLLDNNQTLQLTLSSNGSSIVFSFRK